MMATTQRCEVCRWKNAWVIDPAEPRCGYLSMAVRSGHAAGQVAIYNSGIDAGGANGRGRRWGICSRTDYVGAAAAVSGSSALRVLSSRASWAGPGYLP